VLVFFVAGLVLLMKVDEPRREAAA